MYSLFSTQIKQQGMTLIELMIGLSIIGIVLIVAVPSAQNIIIQNRIVSQINELSGVVQFARATAIDEQVDTIVCPTSDFTNCTTNWSQAKMVFIDENRSGTRNDDEELLVGTPIITSSNFIQGPASVIRYKASGVVNSMATLLICHKDKEAKYARALILSLQGRVKVSRDTNQDGVHEDNSGTDLNCN